MEWPHSNLGPDAATIAAYWLQILGRYSLEDVEGAVEELIASGREHAPGPGVVASVCAARSTDLPDLDEAWAEIDRLKNRWNPAFPGREVPPADAFSHPVVAAFAVPAWSELCRGPAPATRDYGTFYAQQREAYR